jgi:sec-independent protein translocase protein TatC
MYTKENLMIKKKNQKKKTETNQLAEAAKPFIEHLYELRKRLIYIVGSILLFATLAYSVQQHIVSFLLKPANHQQFIYTSPGGGINFLFSICLYVGVAASTPIIVYQLLAFLRPLIETHVVRSVVRYSFFSGILAIIGFCFGYYVGLPAALHFLSNQFTTKQIHPLFTLQEYMSFLTIYLLGSMLLFQLPIILLFIDRIKPLQPRKLFKAQRYVIVGAFIIAMIMAPTTNIFNQLIIAGPIIAMYYLTIALLWAIHKRQHQQPNANFFEGNHGAQKTLTEWQKISLAYRPQRPLIPIPSGNFSADQPVRSNKQLITDIMPNKLKTSTNLSHFQK